MAGPIRIEFAGALYHVPSRGDRREPTYLDDADRKWRYGECDATMVAAHASGGYSHQKIGVSLHHGGESGAASEGKGVTELD